MRDIRNEKLAKQLVEYSLNLEKDEIVRIVAYDFASKPLVKELINAVNNVNAIPIIEYVDIETQSLELKYTTPKKIELLSKWEMQKTIETDAVIIIRGKSNEFEFNNVATQKLLDIAKANKDATDIRVNKKKWVLVNYPTNLYANKAKMSCDDYLDYFYDVVLLDYQKLEEDAQALKELIDATDKVRIVGPNTDISFSIKGMKSVICCAKRNVPDGEVYTAPLKNSVNGYITYNTVSTINGLEFKNVYLEVKDGKIIKAKSDINNEHIEKIFNSDEGARYFGEFAIGLNKMVNKPVNDILFDEKMYGSFHLTPGQCYERCNNGNDSIIHWDLVCIQTPDYGGGKIYFDDILIRENGEFTLEILKPLNK